MVASLAFRAATERDASDLAILIDAASRRLTTFLWQGIAAPGQSWAEAGRERIRTSVSSPSRLSRWIVADVSGCVAGGFVGYPIAEPYDAGDVSDLPDVFAPMTQLEEVAAGSWYVQVASVFPEYRGQGIGGQLLGKAEAMARAAGATRLTIMVESANDGAHRLYLRTGFRERARRPFLPFPGSDDEGDWILLEKGLAGPAR